MGKILLSKVAEMVYELRLYDTVEKWTNEKDIGMIAWECDEILDNSNFKICGKLVSCLGFDHDNEFTVPKGIETVGCGAFVKSDWGCYFSLVKKVIIPSTVVKIEEGAFIGTRVQNVEIHPDSNCGLVKDGALYTMDGNTLLWIMSTNEEKSEFVVPQGVKRLGWGCFDYDVLGTLTIPSSVTEIGFDENHDFQCYDDVVIKASKDSYAIKFAKEHEIKYEEI